MADAVWELMGIGTRFDACAADLGAATAANRIPLATISSRMTRSVVGFVILLFR